MFDQILGFLCVCVLLVCFVAFSVASWRHFDRVSRSRGNQLVRVLTLAGTAVSVWLVFSDWPPVAWQSAASILLGITSLCIFIAAIRSAPSGELHVAFTGSGPGRLVTTGIYRHVRNPLYTSYLAYWAGWIPASDLHLANVCLFALFAAMYFAAVRDEEQFLARTFGDQYTAFKSRTGRFLPKVRSIRPSVPQA